MIMDNKIHPLEVEVECSPLTIQHLQAGAASWSFLVGKSTLDLGVDYSYGIISDFRRIMFTHDDCLMHVMHRCANFH